MRTVQTTYTDGGWFGKKAGSQVNTAKAFNSIKVGLHLSNMNLATGHTFPNIGISDMLVTDTN